MDEVLAAPLQVFLLVTVRKHIDEPIPVHGVLGSVHLLEQAVGRRHGNVFEAVAKPVIFTQRSQIGATDRQTGLMHG